MTEVKVKKPAVTKKAVVKKSASKKSVDTVRVMQIASGSGKVKSQISTLKGLGLGKINRISELKESDAVTGMINKVSHLVKVIKN